MMTSGVTFLFFHHRLALVTGPSRELQILRWNLQECHKSDIIGIGMKQQAV